MYQSRDLERISRHISIIIQEEMSRVGLIFRIFNRVKSTQSLNDKIERKGANYYNSATKLVQDIIGIRIILYFSDDKEIVYRHLKTMFTFVDESIDRNEETKFAPTKLNITYKLPANEEKEFNDIVDSEIIDSTFEIQIRTILSEGWHEIDHDLRYKCINDWEDNSDLSRNFNGILAAIETSEYSILRLFEQLSYRHYKASNFEAMLRTKFRLRLLNYTISEPLNSHLTVAIIREIFKVDRSQLLDYLFSSNVIIPLTIDNLIYIINYKFINNNEINNITPKELLLDLNK